MLNKIKFNPSQFKPVAALRVFLLSVFSLFSIIGYCQAEEKVVLNSLNEAIGMALKNNRDIQIQEQGVKVSSANIKEARSAFLPNVSVNAGYRRNAAVPGTNVPPMMGRDYGVFVGYKDDNSASVEAQENIYDGGASITAFKQAKLAFTEQNETLRATKINIEFEVKRLYYGLLLAYETKRIAKDLVDQAQAHYEDTKKKFEEGTVSKFDVLQSKVQVSLLMPQLVNAQNSIGLIQAEFNKLLGLKVQQELIAHDKLAFVPVEVNEEEFLKEAYMNNPEIKLSLMGVDMSKLSIRYAKSGWFPQLNAMVDYGFRSNDVGDMFNRAHNNWSAGFAVSIPIFDGFATKAKVDAAKAKFAQSLLSKDDIRDKVAVDVKSSYLDLIQAKTIIDSQLDNLEDAKETLRIAKVRFDNGIGINLDILDAQVSLAQVEQNIASGIYDYLIAQAGLERARGRLALTEESNEKKN